MHKEKRQAIFNQYSNWNREESIELQYKSAGYRYFFVGRDATKDLKCFVKL